MTYSLINNCTKSYYNRTLTVQVIIEDVVTWIFLRHSVDLDSYPTRDAKPGIFIQNSESFTSIRVRQPKGWIKTITTHAYKKKKT